MSRSFRRGRVVLAALAVASVASACPETRAAEPSPADCVAASESSLRSGSEHKLRAERAQLLVCASATCPAEIRKECTRRVDEVNSSIPTVVFEPKDAAGNDLTAVRVSMDGEMLADHADGMALPVDPGMHAFVFDASGQAPVQKQLVIREGQKDRHETVAFGASDQPSPAISGPTPREAPSRAPPPDERGSGSGVRIGFAIFTTAVGVAGVASGTVFGLQALSKRNDAQRACPGMCSDQAGVNLWRDAKTAGLVSTVGFVAGGVGLVTGAVLWLSGPSRRNESPNAEVAFGPAGIDVRGRW